MAREGIRIRLGTLSENCFNCFAVIGLGYSVSLQLGLLLGLSCRLRIREYLSETGNSLHIDRPHLKSKDLRDRFETG